MISDLTSLIAVVTIVLLLIPVAVAGIFVVVVVANRTDTDPTGRRPTVVYAYAISFITLFVALFASFAVVSSLCSLIGSHESSASSSLGFGFQSGSSGGSQHPVGDAAARGVVLGLLVLLIAGFAYLVHVRSADRATAGLARAEPSGRVRSS